MAFVKKTSQLKRKGSKKGKKAVFWQIGKSLIVNQPVQLESWKKRWMCGFSPRLRQNIKNSRKSFQKIIFFRKILFFDTFRSNFCSFLYLYFRRATQCFRTKKISKKWIFFENVVFYGAFTKRGVFPMESLKNMQILFFSHVHNICIYPHFLFLHMLCKKNAQLPTAVFATFFRTFFSRFFKKFLLVYIWNNLKSNIFTLY